MKKQKINYNDTLPFDQYDKEMITLKLIEVEQRKNKRKHKIIQNLLLLYAYSLIGYYTLTPEILSNIDNFSLICFISLFYGGYLLAILLFSFLNLANISYLVRLKRMLLFVNSQIYH